MNNDNSVVSVPTPKQRFQSGQNNITRHRELVMSPQFQQTVDCAFLEYQRVLSTVPLDQFNAAAANHIKLIGAQEFMGIFRKLSENDPVPQPNPSNNLIGNTRK